MINAALAINAVLDEETWERTKRLLLRYFGLVFRRPGQSRLLAFDPLPGFGPEGPVEAAREAWRAINPEPGRPVVCCVLYGDPGSIDQGRIDQLEAEARRLERPICILGLPFPTGAARGDSLGPVHSTAGGWQELLFPPENSLIANLESGQSDPDTESGLPTSDPDDLRARPDRRVVASAGDTVVATVFAPPTVKPEELFLVQVFAHLANDADLAASLARETDSDAGRRVFKSLSLPVPEGTALSFHLSITGARVGDPIASVIWRKQTEAVQFEVVVPQGAAQRIIGTVVASIDSVPVGHLKFTLQLSQRTRWISPSGDDATRYRSAFVSYASADRDEVLARVQMLGPLGIKFFQDVMSLEPGDRWARELYRHIDECDLFLLFWSRAARESEWVEREVAHALARRGPTESGRPEIVPVILEGPPIVPPPPTLASLHFDDRVLYFRSRSG
jgi:hypothetical protein